MSADTVNDLVYRVVDNCRDELTIFVLSERAHGAVMRRSVRTRTSSLDGTTVESDDGVKLDWCIRVRVERRWRSFDEDQEIGAEQNDLDRGSKRDST